MKNGRNLVSAKRRLESGTASKYISHFEAEIQPGDNVVLWCRESHRQNAPHLDDLEATLRNAATKRRVNVVGVHRCIVLGFDCSDCSRNRPRGSWVVELVRAAELAKKHGAKLLATETDRFVRHPAYEPKLNPTAQARECDLADLVFWTGGVPLLTLLHPDSPPSKVKSNQSKRGQQAVGHKGGRPPVAEPIAKPGDKKRRREEMLPLVLKLHSRGLKLGQIAGETDVPRRTVSRWIAIHR